MRECKLFIVIFLLWNSIIAQTYTDPPSIESIDETSESFEEVPFQFNNESPNRSQRGPIYFEERNSKPEIKSRYKGRQFNYEQETPPPKKEFRKSAQFSVNTSLVNILLYSILILILAVVIYHIFKNAGGFQFGSLKKKIKVSYSDSQSLVDDDDIENNDFASLIQRAKTQEDYRRAIRYYYLWVLQKLTERNLIQWHKEKTNYDYFLELDKKTIQTDFSQSNYIFENIWYGNFNLDAVQFQKAESIFKQTLNKI